MRLSAAIELAGFIVRKRTDFDSLFQTVQGFEALQNTPKLEKDSSGAHL